MKQIVKIFSKTIDGLTYLTGWISAICIVAAAFIVTEGVIVRKLFGISTIWQIEASVFLLIFSVFVGSAFVQKDEHHLNVDLVLIYLSPKVREVILVIVSIITAALVLILAWYSWPMWWEAFVNNEHSESLWGPPLWIPYIFLPLGMTLLFLQYILYIARKIDALRKGVFERETKRSELKDIKLEKPDKDS